ncbi:hypothetical protein E2C01_048300 [Portunus trituberculatus]|uniref:Headcase middle domain-containing protein n=1 Tax=Portunus trituberculatus TaxID=210409 RepID=A0A5B7G9V0_PORTR|nr:hypothetical protein [Portunus trituberculatus]
MGNAGVLPTYPVPDSVYSCFSGSLSSIIISFLLPRPHGSGGSMFARRADFSSFNVLPRDKINSYHIKVGADLVQFIHVVLFAHSPVCFPNGNSGNDFY